MGVLPDYGLWAVLSYVLPDYGGLGLKLRTTRLWGVLPDYGLFQINSRVRRLTPLAVAALAATALGCVHNF